MFKPWSYLVSLALVLTFALALAPRPCLGDGQGGACQASACACVAECSCRSAHEAAKAGLADAHHDAGAMTESCCVVEAPAEAASCHGGASIPHFAPPVPMGEVVLPVGPVTLSALAPATEPSRWARGCLDGLPRPPREKPPRLSA